MKKLLALLMVVVLSVSLCACGSNKLELNKSDVESTYTDNKGTLDINASNDKVKSYTLTIEDANADNLTDRDYCYGAIEKLLNGSTGDTTLGELQVAQVIMAVIETVNFLDTETDEEFDADAFVEELLDITCDGKVFEYSGWTVRVEINEANNSATIIVE